MESSVNVSQSAFVKTGLSISTTSLKKTSGHLHPEYMGCRNASKSSLFTPSFSLISLLSLWTLKIYHGTGQWISGQSHIFKPCVDLNTSSVVPRRQIVSFVWLNPSYIISVSDEVPGIVGSSANSCKGNAMKGLEMINPGLSTHCWRNTYSSSGGPLSLEFLSSNRVLV